MEFIHDVTGSISTFFIYALGISGAAMFYFRFVHKYIPLRRNIYLRVHRLGAVIFLAVLAVHYLTTDKSNIYVLLGIFLLAAVILIGAALRIKSVKARSFKKAVYLKVAVFAIAMVLITIGHGIFEKEHKNHEHGYINQTALMIC